MPGTVLGTLHGPAATLHGGRVKEGGYKKGGEAWSPGQESVKSGSKPRWHGSREPAPNGQAVLPLHLQGVSCLEAGAAPKTSEGPPRHPGRYPIWRKESQWEIQDCSSNQKRAVNQSHRTAIFREKVSNESFNCST